MTGGIPPANPFAVAGGRVGVVAASRGGGARRAGRGIVFHELVTVIVAQGFREAHSQEPT